VRNPRVEFQPVVVKRELELHVVPGGRGGIGRKRDAKPVAGYVDNLRRVVAAGVPQRAQDREAGPDGMSLVEPFLKLFDLGLLKVEDPPENRHANFVV
jgi:hypothetical protein